MVVYCNSRCGEQRTKRRTILIYENVIKRRQKNKRAASRETSNYQLSNCKFLKPDFWTNAVYINILQIAEGDSERVPTLGKVMLFDSQLSACASLNGTITKGHSLFSREIKFRRSLTAAISTIHVIPYTHTHQVPLQRLTDFFLMRTKIISFFHVERKHVHFYSKCYW